MYLQRSKTTLDSLKSVFNVFRKKSSLGAPADCFLAELAPGRVEWWGEGGGWEKFEGGAVTFSNFGITMYLSPVNTKLQQ